MQKIWFSVFFLGLSLSLMASDLVVKSPDGSVKVALSLSAKGELVYDVIYKEKQLLEPSPLGMITNVSDFSKNLSFVEVKEQPIRKNYRQSRIKKSEVNYKANELVAVYQTAKKRK